MGFFSGLTKGVYKLFTERRYACGMTRFSIHYEEPAPRKPPPSGWLVFRVFLWTLLIACAGFWCWSALAA